MVSSERPRIVRVRFVDSRIFFGRAFHVQEALEVWHERDRMGRRSYLTIDHKRAIAHVDCSYSRNLRVARQLDDERFVRQKRSAGF